jgi:hypothetical protein
MPLRFTSLAVISLRWDFHPQECAHAGRIRKKPAKSLTWRAFSSENLGVGARTHLKLRLEPSQHTVLAKLVLLSMLGLFRAAA